ncbi:hypothetical protein [Micromonospora sp. LOL_023]|uniref:hypothetical protein n=1 Tax=Micromonospora sp. LOL_023 TaxID=3345418 RepID=UPI003A835A2D
MTQRYDWVLAMIAVTAASTVAMVLFPQVRHWFIVPVTTAGALISVETISWLRRRTDLLDPQAILSVAGFHFFYLTPILHVVLDHWPRFLLSSADWPAALGSMALVNTAGLCLYRGVLAIPSRAGRRTPAHPPAAAGRATTELRPDVLYVFGLLAVTAGILAFGALVLLMGGPGQLINAYTQDRAALDNLGWLLIVAESFPLIGFALALVRWRNELARRPWLIFLLLTSLAALQFMVGGLRGSRSNTLWPIVLGFIMVHLLVRHVSWRVLVVTALSTGVFLYSYGLYKGAGTEVLGIIHGQETVADVSARTGRDLPTLLLGDLSRADVQALVLERSRQGSSDLGHGSSYVNAMLLPVPSTLLPYRPSDKVHLGTDLTTGVGMYESGYRSSRIYGLAGEATLNFGPVGAILSFLLLGGFTRWCRQRYLDIGRNGSLAARLLAPMLSIATPMVLLNDAGNYMWFFLKYFLPLATVVAVALAVSTLRHGRGRAARR